MIHRYLKNEAQQAIPSLGWSINFYTGADNTGTVYTEGGAAADLYDPNLRYPEYMIYIRSSNFDAAEQHAQAVYDTFHKRSHFTVTEKGKTYQVLFLQALSEPLRLGVDNDKMEYSINLQATLREMK